MFDKQLPVQKRARLDTADQESSLAADGCAATLSGLHEPAASSRALVVHFPSTAEVVGGRRLREHHADASTGTSAAETVSALLTTLDFAGWATTPRLCLRSGLLAAAGASKIARRGDGGEGEGRARHADGLVDIDSANDTYRPCTAQGKGMATRGERESTTTMWQSRDERRRPAAANAVS